VAAAPSPPRRMLGAEAERRARARGVGPGASPGELGSTYSWDVGHFRAWVDNYNPNMASSTATYDMRYLYNNASWCGPECPIFMYCGNEGFIELFAANSGFLWESAVPFGALVVFPEHRFYGESLPFGNASFELENLGLLTAEQAIADYAWFVTSLKANLSAPNAPVVLFGGSYGGMLAAWMRIKFPTISAGAIASSAPVLEVPGIMDPT
jgi:lysosomal Pro-X carboxypeptidase